MTSSRELPPLLRTGGNITRAAQLLGLSRKALRYRLRRYGIERPDLIVSSEILRPTHTPSPPAAEDPPTPLSSTQGEEERYAQSPGNTADRAHRLLSSGWEQRTVAVLAIDLTLPRSTGLAVAPHEPWMVTNRWEDTIADKIQGFGGVFLRRSQPLLVVGFGLPRSLEQMPHRAVQAALAIRHLVEEAQLGAG
jgi:Bacterial regulatory protein, Fis family